MTWPKSLYTKHLEAELERLRNENRILLSALLERVVSREAAMMLRKPEELSLSQQDLRARAKVHYEARNEAAKESADKPPAGSQIDIRHWRSSRMELESVSQAEAAAGKSNDSVERIQARVEADRKAAQGA